MTKAQIDELSQNLISLMNEMEDELLRRIAAQLVSDGNISDSSKWRIRQLARAGRLDKEALAVIKEYIGTQSEMLGEALYNAALSEIGNVDEMIRGAAARGLTDGRVKAPADRTAQNALKSFLKQAQSDLNMVNTVMRYKAKQAYVNAVNSTFWELDKKQRVHDALGTGALEVISGTESLQTAVRDVLKKLSEKGIPAFIDAGGHEWKPETYVRMDLRTTMGNTARTAQWQRCDDFGIDLIEVDSHMGAREKCARDQGKIYSRSGKSGTTLDGSGRTVTYYPFSSTSYGQPDGLFGINCGHHSYPYIPGASYQRYFPVDEEKNSERYKEFQHQRYLERKIRESKRECMLLSEAGDKDGLKKAAIRLRTRKEEYSVYSRAHGLSVHSDRTQVYGYDRSKSMKAVWAEKKANKPLDNSGGSDIIKERNTTVVNGKNVVGQWKHRNNFDSEIDDIIDYQGFNGKPKIIYDRQAFDDYVEKDHFLAERTFCADSQERLKTYDNQLKAVNGEDYFYVNCGVGGAQYGQGMYCAADFTKGTISFDKFEHEIKQYAWGDKFPFSKTNWLTLDPSAKILDIPSGSNRLECFEFVSKKYEVFYLENRLNSSPGLRKEWEEFQKSWSKAQALNGSSKSSDWDKAYALFDEAERKYPEAYKLHGELMNCTDGKDAGVMAAEMGYDVINAQGHGTTDSYSVVLNRTKLIIYGGNDYEYKQK